jgi:aspartyl-tRNA(Asn)/glutamyl-tRNA(Gln) amidotransferase subunit A
LAPLALATDGGGSIRRPAAHTGLVGLKPSVNRILRGGGFPQLMFDCEVAGAIARSVADARLMFEALAQSHQPHSAKPKRARILFVERFGTAPVDRAIHANCREAAAHLAALGHDVTRAEMPIDIGPAMDAWRALGDVGLARLAMREPRFFECASPDFIAQAETGASYSGVDYAALIETLLEFRTQTARAFEQFDILMTPATAAQPWPAAEPYPTSIDGEPVGPRGHAVFTGWVNACGHPAIVFPVHPADDGMPIGIQLVGAPDTDEYLLDIAEEYESAHPWSHLWPPLAL